MSLASLASTTNPVLEECIIKRMDGWTSTLLNGFYMSDIAEAVTDNVYKLTGIEWDSKYLYLSGENYVYRMDGFSSTLSASGRLVIGTSATTTVSDICWDGTNLYYLDAERYELHRCTGYSNTVDSTLTISHYTQLASNWKPNGITCDSTYLYIKTMYGGQIWRIALTAFDSPPSSVESMEQAAKSIYLNDNEIQYPHSVTYDGNYFYTTKVTAWAYRGYIRNKGTVTLTNWQAASSYDAAISNIGGYFGIGSSVNRFTPATTGSSTTIPIIFNDNTNLYYNSRIGETEWFYIENMVWGEYYKRMGLDPWVEDPVPDPGTTVIWNPPVATSYRVTKIILGGGSCYFNTKFLPDWDPDRDVNIKMTYSCSNNVQGQTAVFYTYVWNINNADSPNLTNYTINYADYITSENENYITSSVLTNARIPWSFTDSTGDQAQEVLIQMMRDSTGDGYNGHIRIHNIELYQPKAGVEYGYCCGGDNGTVTSNLISSIDRIHFPFENANAISSGSISTRTQRQGGCNSSINGYVMGGVNESSVAISTVDKIRFPMNSGNAVTVGNLTTTEFAFASCNSSTYGYSMGGSNSDTANAIKKIDFSMDTSVTTSISGDLAGSNIRYSYNSGVNSSTYGYSLGTYNASTAVQRTIQRFNFAVGGNATDIANLSTTEYNGNQYGNFRSCSYNSSRFGYIAGGNSVGTVQKIEFATPTVDSVYVCEIPSNDPDTSGLESLTGCNSSLYGFSMGGKNSVYGVYLSTVDKISFALDGSATVCDGSLTSDNLSAACGIDGVDFVTMFI